MRSHADQTGQRDHDVSATSDIVRPGASREHAPFNLFHGWTSDSSDKAIEGLSTSSDQGHGASAAIQVKRSNSQDAFDSVGVDAALRFQSITFPDRDVSSTISLDKIVKNDGEEFLKNGKRVPPSKRPGVSHAKKTPPNHIKRPRNAYIIFRSHTVSQRLIPKEIEHDHRNISRIIAHMWKSLSPDDRAYYEQIAKEEKERHKALYPDYRYQPTTRRTNVSKRNVKKLENGEEECQEIADIILKAQGKQGVVIQPEPSKAMKRAREGASRTSPRKRSRKTVKPESPTGEQNLTAVFLHPSPSTSPTGAGVIHVPSPEPIQLASQPPSVDDEGVDPSNVPSPSPDHLFGRRASSVPLLRPCSPPPPFSVAAEQHLNGEGHHGPLAEPHADFHPDISQAGVDVSEESIMPAPSWRTKRPQPLPLANTWQHCSYDDQSLPSPRSFDSLGPAAKQAMARSRTAMPSTPSSGSFRGFFHPWAYDHGNESMLISPMTASFQDLRRRSSLARCGMVAGRPQGHFYPEQASSITDRDSNMEGSGDRATASDSQVSDVQLFEQAARAAEISLGAEASATQPEEADVFAFDPALEGEGGGPIPTSLPAQEVHCESQTVQSTPASPSLTTFSPRPSFSGSTLAAAARDWASMKRRRSKLEARSVIEPVEDTTETWSQTVPNFPESRYDASLHDTNEPVHLKSSLEGSVERAVALALGKEAGSNANAERSKIVQQILSSLSAELLLQRATSSEAEQAAETSSAISQNHSEPLRSSFSRGSQCPSSKSSSPNVEHNRRAALRASHGSASQLYAAAEAHRVPKPLPSPLQLAMSNHRDLATDYHSHQYLSSQHCS